MTNIDELKDEELKKVTGGAEVGSYGGHSVGDYHRLSYSNNAGHVKFTIEKIDDSRINPFYVKSEHMYSNYTIYATDYSWFTLQTLDYYWNNSTLN